MVEFTLLPRALALAGALLLGAASPALRAGDATPAAYPYDTQADAHAQVDAAFAEANRTHRIVLLDFGGNWCPDCRMLSGVFQLPDVHSWMADRFVLVTIDIGRRTRNMDISERFGVTVQGVPTVLMVAPDGRLLNKDNPYGLADARAMSPQAVVDLLAKMAKF